MDTPQREAEKDLSEFETNLKRLDPKAVALQRDRMLFESGRSAAAADHRGRTAWFASAASLAIAVGLAGLLIRERLERSALEIRLAAVERAIAPPRFAVDPPEPPVDPDSYLALRRVLVVGLSESRNNHPSVPVPSFFVAPGVVAEPLRARSSDQLLPF